MSLYNALFGWDPFSGILLELLGLTPGDVGRFRDCYLKEEDGEGPRRIVIYTRNGGDNREEYQPILDLLSERPGWIRDFDDDFDCTYASIEFNVPVGSEALIDFLIRLRGSEVMPREKWNALFADLKGQPETEAGKRALKIGEDLFGKINEALKLQEPKVTP